MKSQPLDWKPEDPIQTPGDRRRTPEEAFVYCERLATEHYENFPVGSRWIPEHMRKHVHAIYTFARIADDFADEPWYAESRLHHLGEWRKMLAECYEGTPRHPVFLALQQTVQKYNIPRQLLADLITAFEQDCRKKRYANFDEVLNYCKYSANPVGRLVLILFGYRDEELFHYSDRICTALQLTNFWQDLSIDIGKDRIYLPQDEQEQYGVEELLILSGGINESLQKLLAFQVDRTEKIFYEGRPLPDKLGKQLRFEIRLVWLGGMRILERIRKVDYDVFQQRPKINRYDKARLLLKALTWRKSVES